MTSPYPGGGGLLSGERQAFHQELLGRVLRADVAGTPSNADQSNGTSVRIARGIFELLGGTTTGTRLAAQSSGVDFETAVAGFLSRTFVHLPHLRPGNWDVVRLNARDRVGIARYDQYQHLKELEALAKQSRALAAALGREYVIAPDTVIVRHPETDAAINAPGEIVDGSTALLSSLRESNGPVPILHASVSCKWTIRSDRAQNARTEALNMLRNRKGPLPHIVVVTGEPLPSRLASLALGTGDIDCLYHFALPELRRSLEQSGVDDSSRELVETMVSGKRLRDIADLPLDLAI